MAMTETTSLSSVLLSTARLNVKTVLERDNFADPFLHNQLADLEYRLGLAINLVEENEHGEA
jgi:hypothetical protein